jgi:hypothetical protein
MSNFNPSILWFEDEIQQKEFIAFPATMEEVLESSATVSKYPVQQGFEISNHMIRHNRKISLSAIVPETINGGIATGGAEAGSQVGGVIDSLFGTNLAGVTSVVGGVLADPKGVADSYIQGVTDSLTPVVSGIAGAVDEAAGWFNIDTGLSTTVSQYTQRNSRIQDTLDKLKQIQEDGLLCSLSTVHGNYNDLVLVNFVLTTNADSVTAAQIEMEFEEVIIVDNLGNRVTRVALSDLSPALQQDMMRKASTDFNNQVDDILDIGNIWP